MNKTKYEDIVAKVTSYHLLTDMSVAIYNKAQECLVSLQTHEAFSDTLEKKIKSNLSLRKSIIEFKNNDQTHFTMLYVNIQGEAFHILLGPYIYEILSQVQVKKLMLKKPCSHKDSALLELYYSRMKKMSQGAMILHYQLLEKTLEYESIGKSENIELNDSLATKLEYREIDFFHHYYLAEKLFLNNLFHNRLKVNPSEYIAELDTALLSDDLLRSEKNLRIVTVGVVERTAIDIGMDPHFSFTIADAFIRNIEKAQAIAEIEMYTLKMLKDYSAAFRQQREKKYSKIISDSLMYIDRNLASELSLKIIASHAHVSHEHLSRLFKKEVGMNIKDYILSEKMHEGKILLAHSSHTLQEISDILHFSSKSYFIRCFKKVVGVTPIEFKNKGE